MSRTQHDYAALKQEYVSTDISVRELCRKHDVKSWSTVNERKKREDWDGLREQFRRRIAEGEVGSLVQARLKLVSDIHEELLLAVRVAIRRFIKDVDPAAGDQAISARDLMGLIDKFLLLSGSTPHRTESRSVDTHSYTFDGVLEGAPPELLRELAELARERGSGGQPMGRGPLVVLEGTG